MPTGRPGTSATPASKTSSTSSIAAELSCSSTPPTTPAIRRPVCRPSSPTYPATPHVLPRRCAGRAGSIATLIPGSSSPTPAVRPACRSSLHRCSVAHRRSGRGIGAARAVLVRYRPLRHADGASEPLGVRRTGSHLVRIGSAIRTRRPDHSDDQLYNRYQLDVTTRASIDHKAAEALLSP